MHLKTPVDFETPYGSYPNCSLDVQRYPNGDLRLQLYNHDGPVGTATTQPPQRLGRGEIAVKDYGENQGMLPALMEAGLVEPPHRSMDNGYAAIPICRPKGELLEVIKQIEPTKPTVPEMTNNQTPYKFVGEKIITYYAEKGGYCLVAYDTVNKKASQPLARSSSREEIEMMVANYDEARKIIEKAATWKMREMFVPAAKHQPRTPPSPEIER
jgi:hypothetical protein